MDKFVQRIIALALAAVLLVTSVYIDASLLPRAEAEDMPASSAATLAKGTYIAPMEKADITRTIVSSESDTLYTGTVTISSPTQLYVFARWSKTHSTAGVTVSVDYSGSFDLGEDFVGMGSAEYPFSGTITTLNAVAFNLNENCPALFEYLSVSASVFPAGSGNIGEVTINLNGAGSGLAQVLVADTPQTMEISDRITISGRSETISDGGSVTYPAAVTNRYSPNSGIQDAGLLFGRVLASGIDLGLIINAAIDVTGKIAKKSTETEIDPDILAAVNQNPSATAATGGSAGGLIGAIEAAGHQVTLTLGPRVHVDGVDITAQNGSAGGLVGRVNGDLVIAGATALQTGSITAYTGSAGGAVGHLEPDAALTLPENFTVSRAADGTEIAAYAASVSDNNGAGGVVGAADSGSSLLAPGVKVQHITVAGGAAAGGVVGALQGRITATGTSVSDVTVGGDGCSGGYVGRYDAPETVTIDSAAIAAMSGNYLCPLGKADSASGGLYGRVKASGTDFTVDGITVESTTVLSASGNLSVGGLVGAVKNNKEKTFQVKNTTVTSQCSTTASTVKACGGVIGLLEENSYADVQDVTVSKADYSKVSVAAVGLAPSSAAGGVGRVSDGASLTAGNCSVLQTKNAEERTVFIGDAGKGSVVRLAGSLICEDNTFGGIVRRQDGSLIYASDTSFTISRNADVAGDDIGNYGQIINNSAIGGIITFDETTHTASIGTMTNATATDAGVEAEIGTLADYARLAISMTSHGYFSAVPGVDSSNCSTKLYGTNHITLTSNIDLTGTGIEGLTRSCDEKDSPKAIEIIGNGHTVTLDVGAFYGVSGANLPRGLFAHNTTDGKTWQTYAGLAGQCGSLTATDLTVNGKITVNRNSGNTKNYAGGLCGRVTGAVTLDNCVSEVEIGACRNNDESYFGGFVGYESAAAINASITGCTSRAAITSISKDKTPYMGGLIARISGSNGGTVVITDADTTGVSLTSQDLGDLAAYVGGVTGRIDGAKETVVTLSGRLGGSVTMASDKTGTVGGLLGYSWENVKTVVTNTSLGCVAGVVTPTSISGSVNAGKAYFGGLLHTVTGQLVIGSGTDITGTFASAANNGYNALVVREGKELYLEVADGTAFGTMLKSHIESGALTVPTSTGSQYFDLLVGSNIDERGTDDAPATGGIVTIETGGAVGQLPKTGSAWYTFVSGDYDNPNTRYYTNVAALNGLSTNPVVTATDTAAELMRFHLSHYTNKQDGTKNTAISNLFATGVTAVTLGSDVSVSGYCFYPTTVGSLAMNLDGHTLTFGLPDAKNVQDAVNNQEGQLYMVQTGLVLDASGTVSVHNGTLQGKVNRWATGTNSGAIVTGKVEGKLNSDKITRAQATLTLSGLTLNGLVIDGMDAAIEPGYAPLLVNKVTTCVTGQFSDIREADDAYAEGAHAATSLLGRVQYYGTENIVKSSDIYFNFSGIHLSDTIDGSIFTRATLIEAIDCATGCTFFYNFNIEEETNAGAYYHGATYGRELPLDREYYNDDSTIAGYADPDVTTFGVYLPYVRNPASNTNFSVNIKGGDLDKEGWGTYANPYIIDSADKLFAVYNLINNGQANTNWKINYPNSLSSPTDYSTYSGFNGETFTKTVGDGANQINLTAMRAWMQGAYYELRGTIDLSTCPQISGNANKFGIGTKDNKFHGVIVGKNNNNSVGVSVVVMPAPVDGGENRGLVAEADGCVVKDLTIIYDNAKAAYLPAAATTAAAEVVTDSYMGGVIARITGGDNIIENVKVEFGESTLFKPNATNGHLSCVGGYVGLVQNGGLLLRGMGNSTGLSDTTSGDAVNSDAYLYVNPCVGRVLDGYVIDQTGRVDEDGKRVPVVSNRSGAAYTDYTIPYMELTRDKSTPTDLVGFTSTGSNSNTVFSFDVSNDEELFVLAAAMNSAKGYVASSTTIPGTRQRWGDYSQVGNASASDLIGDDLAYNRGTVSGVAATSVSYLGSRFQNGMSIVQMEDTSNCTVDITLTDNADVSGYKTGFRGIGGQFSTAPSSATTPVVKLRTFDGGGHTVTLAMEQRQYGSVDISGDSGGVLTADSPYFSAGMGLFNQLTSDSATLTDVQLRGSVRHTLYDKNGEQETKGFTDRIMAAGGLVGMFNKASATGTRRFENVTLLGSGTSLFTVESADAAGGMVGYEDDGKKNAAVYQNCGYDGINVAGRSKAGGFVGYGRFYQVTVTNTATETTLQNGTIHVDRTNLGGAIQDDRRTDIGAGGVVGGCYGMKGTHGYSLTMTGVQASHLTVWTRVADKSKASSAYLTGAGGLMGKSDWINLTFTDCRIRNTGVYSGRNNDVGQTATDTDLLLAGSNTSTTSRDGMAGGLLGCFGNNSNQDSIQRSIHMLRCAVTADAGEQTTLAGDFAAGGLLGNIRDNNTIRVTASITDCAVSTGEGSTYIMGGTRSGGAIGFVRVNSSNLKVQISGLTVGSESGNTHIFATTLGDAGSAGGAAGEIWCDTSIDHLSVTNAIIAGVHAGGAMGNSGGATIKEFAFTVADATVTDCLFYSGSTTKNDNIGGNKYAAGGIAGYINANQATTKLARCTVQGCTIGVNGYFAGGFCGYISSGAKNLYANSLLWVRNEMGKGSNQYGAGISYKTLADCATVRDGITEIGFSVDQSKAGLFAGYNGTTAEVLGISRVDNGAAVPTAYKDVASGSANVVYADYNYFVSGTDLASDTDDVRAATILTSPAYTLRTASGTTQTDIVFRGDAVGFVQSNRASAASTPTNTPLAQQAAAQSALWNKQFAGVTDLLTTYGSIAASASGTDVPADSAANALAALASDTQLRDLPLLNLKNQNVDAVLRQYADLLTNGGFTTWEGLTQVTGTSEQYIVETDGTVRKAAGSGSGSDTGSVKYTNGTFARNGEIFDRILPGAESTFTVLTLYFSSSAVDKVTYNLQLLVYYPQVMQMEIHTRVVGKETYNIEEMLKTPYTSTAQIAPNGAFTLYVEYAFDQERLTDAWNFDKVIYSRKDATPGRDIPIGTSMMLIALGATAAGNRTYYYTVTEATKEIRLSDFTALATSTDQPVTNTNVTYAADMLPLASLTSLSALSGQTITETADKDGKNWGVERYLLVAHMPKNDPSSVYEEYYLFPDVRNTQNVELQEIHMEKRAFVALWGETKISASPTDRSAGTVLTGNTAVWWRFNPKIEYPSAGENYIYNVTVSNTDLSAKQYAVLQYKIIDNNNKPVILPDNTLVTIKKNGKVISTQRVSGGLLVGSYVFTDINKAPRDMLRNRLDGTEAYTLMLDFTDVDAEIFDSTFPAGNYTVQPSLHLVDNWNYPESGHTMLNLTEVALVKEEEDSTIVSVSVVDDVRDLAANFHTSEAGKPTNYGYIDFEVDCITTATESDIRWTMQLVLQTKREGTYTNILAEDISRYATITSLASSSDCGVDTAKATATELTIRNIPLSDGEDKRWFRLQINSEIAYFANYKLKVVLTGVSDDGTTIIRHDHFIYTVAKVNTTIS